MNDKVVHWGKRSEGPACLRSGTSRRKLANPSLVSDETDPAPYPSASICASISDKAAVKAARRDAFDVRCERMFSRCRFSACLRRSLAARLSAATRRSASVIRASPGRGGFCSVAFAICSSTDLLSHPRAISSFYGCLQFSVPRRHASNNICTPSVTGVFPHARLADPILRH